MAKHIAEIKSSANRWDKYVEQNSKTIDDSTFKFPVDDFTDLELLLENVSFRNEMVFI